MSIAFRYCSLKQRKPSTIVIFSKHSENPVRPAFVRPDVKWSPAKMRLWPDLNAKIRCIIKSEVSGFPSLLTHAICILHVNCCIHVPSIWLFIPRFVVSSGCICYKDDSWLPWSRRVSRWSPKILETPCLWEHGKWWSLGSTENSSQRQGKGGMMGMIRGLLFRWR